MNDIKNQNIIHFMSHFYNNQCYFGSYPTQTQVDEMELFGINYFIDLTHKHESKITHYITNKATYLNFPIKDFYIPKDILPFYHLVHHIKTLIENNHKIYIHCKGGHGRSGILVACLLGVLKNLDGYNAIKETTFIHNQRKNLKKKYLKDGSPQTSLQKHFVINFFKPYVINIHNPLHNNYEQLFTIYGFDVFENASSAFDYFKNLIQKHEKKYNIVSHEDETILYNILYHKMKQNLFIVNKLLHTGFRPLMYESPFSNHIMGKLLEEFREYCFHNNIYKVNFK